MTNITAEGCAHPHPVKEFIGGRFTGEYVCPDCRTRISIATMRQRWDASEASSNAGSGGAAK